MTIEALVKLFLLAFLVGLGAALLVWGVATVVGGGTPQERKRWGAIAGALVAVVILVSGLY